VGHREQIIVGLAVITSRVHEVGDGEAKEALVPSRFAHDVARSDRMPTGLSPARR